MRPNVRPDAGDPAGLGGSAEPVAPPLLPCPFCGGAAHIESAVDDPGEWFVGCQGCNAILGPVFEDSPCADEDTPAPRVMLTNAWNRRALARAPQGDPPAPEPFGHIEDPAWQRGEIHRVDPNELYVEMACCGFRYSADHEDSTTEGYSCPLCAPQHGLSATEYDALVRDAMKWRAASLSARGVPAPQGDAAPREPLEAVLHMLNAKAPDEHLIPSAVQWVRERIIEALGGASSSGSAPELPRFSGQSGEVVPGACPPEEPPPDQGEILASAAIEALRRGFATLCFSCLEGFNGASCPRCPGAAPRRGPNPEPSAAAIDAVCDLAFAQAAEMIAKDRPTPDGPEYREIVRQRLRVAYRVDGGAVSPLDLSTGDLYEIAERVRQVGSLDNAVSVLRAALRGVSAPAPSSPTGESGAAESGGPAHPPKSPCQQRPV